MKCPICGETLRPGKKDPNYLLCYSCKKKFKAPARKTEESEEQKYSNIPPKKVREKGEQKVKEAYEDMLATEDDTRRKKKKKAEAAESKRKKEYEEEKVSKLPIIILALAILAVSAVIVYMLLT